MSLEKYRKEIDSIDKKILLLLEKRFVISKKVGKYKKAHSLPVKDRVREKQIIENKINSTKLPSKFIKKLFKLIFKYSRKIQEKD